MSIPVITMDAKGVIHDPAQKIDWILSYLIETAASQSNIHRSEIMSIPDIVRKYGSNPVELKNTMRNTLTNAFGSYFDEVLVEVSVADVANDPSRFNLVISSRVEQDGKWYQISNTLYVTNDKISKAAEVTRV